MLPNICSRYERMQCSRIEQHYCRSVVDVKHTNDNIRSFLRFFHCHMIDSPTSVVLLGSDRNRVGSTGRGRCSYNRLTDTSAWIGTSIGVMSMFTTAIAPTVSLLRVLGSLGSLNTLIPSSRSLDVVGVLNHLTLWSRESLSSCLRPWQKLWLSRREHRSSKGRSNSRLRATARLMLMHQLTLVLHHSSAIL
jgi:hypothetical protein